MGKWWNRHNEVLDGLTAAINDEHWDDVRPILDDHLCALSLSAPQAVAAVWKKLPRSWLMANPRYLMGAEFSHAIAWPFPLIAPDSYRVFTNWVHSQEKVATRDVLEMKTTDLRQHLVAGRFTHAVVIADEISELVSNPPDVEGFDDVLGNVLIRVGMARLLSGDTERAIGSFSEAWRWSTNARPHPLAPYAAGYCALSYALSGDYAHAAMWKDRMGKPPPGDPGTMAFRHQSAGVLANALLAIGSSDQSTSRAAADLMDHNIAAGELWWIAIHARARLALYWGDRTHAIREIEGELRAYPSLTGAASLAGITLRSDLSDLRQAQGQLEAASHALAELDAHSSHPAAVCSVTRLLMLEGNLTDALGYLEAACRRRTVSTPVCWEVLRANLMHLTQDLAEEKAIRHAAQRIEHTGAFDAALGALPAVHHAIAGYVRLPERPQALFVPEPLAELTPREVQILELLDSSLSVKDIAAGLYISHNTAKSHLRRLYRKLGAENRTQAIQLGRDLLKKRQHGSS